MKFIEVDLMQSLIRNKRAFTIAEVLITLSVIGVVAAMTIPSLIADKDKSSNRAALKKFAAELAAVGQQIKLELGSGDLSGFSDNSWPQYWGFIYYEKYMSFQKRCNDDDCWHASGEWFDALGNPQGSATQAHGHSAILSNGMLFANRDGNNSCGYAYGDVDDVCTINYIDVNGYKGPNKYGNDIFILYLTKDGSIKTPVFESGKNGWRCAAINEYCRCGEGQNGKGCSSYVLRNIDY